MIYVRDVFKTCVYYNNNDVEDVINDICLNWNVKLTVFLLFLLQCVNKDIIIILGKVDTAAHGIDATITCNISGSIWIFNKI